MKYVVKPQQDHVAVEVTDLGAQRDAALAAFQACAGGRCSCPTGEYAKLAGIAVEAAAGGVRIRLEPKPGATIAVAEIERCLDHTATELAAKPGD
jgi:hypothetical protein